MVSGLFKLRTPPLFQIRDKQGGVSYESARSPKFPPCGGLKIAKTLIFGRFSKFQNPKIFRPSAEKISGQTRGGSYERGVS